MIEVTNVDHLGIRVTDEGDSIAFYEQLEGLERYDPDA